MTPSSIPLAVRIPFFHVAAIFNPDINLCIFFPNTFFRISFIFQDITSGAHLPDSLYRIYKGTGVAVEKETGLAGYSWIRFVRQ